MATGNLTKTCRWVLADNNYCQKPVSYIMVDDGGEPNSRKVREYRPFCDEHMKKHWDWLKDSEDSDNN